MKILIVLSDKAITEHRSYIYDALESLNADITIARSTGLDLQKYQETEVLITATDNSVLSQLSRLSKLKWIHFLSSGIEKIWNHNLRWERYKLTKSAGVHKEAIAEYIIGSIMMVEKKYYKYINDKTQRKWDREWCTECYGKYVCIVGMGAVGRRLAEIVNAFNMKVIAVSKTQQEYDNACKSYSVVELTEAVRYADYIIPLVPLTNGTYHLIDTAILKAMRSDAWIINASRGSVIDESALVQALKQHIIGGAVLDVFENEPLDVSSPLWGFDNVVITPHIAGTTQLYMKKAMHIFMENYELYMKGMALKNKVSTTVRY